MKTIALRLYGKMDARLESFQLPDPREDEILAEVVCDKVCMSSYKLLQQGSEHKRVPADIAEDPIIIGHEFAGRLLKVGRQWRKHYREGEKFAIQPALDTTASLKRPGFSFPTLGGDSTHVLFPPSILETGCLLPYGGDAFFKAALSEPMSCIIGACKNQYHVNMDTYAHQMGIRSGGQTAVLAGCGPMGLGVLDYLLHGPVNPSLVAVTDIDPGRLDRAGRILEPQEAEKNGTALHYLNARETNPAARLMELSHGLGYDDVFVLAPLPELIELADSLLAPDGCLNFFAGPTSPDLSAKINFYKVHYGGTHVVGTSGGNIDDSLEALDLMAGGKINPAIMITHIGGLTAARDTTLRLSQLGGGKKLIYTHLDLPLISLEDLSKLGRNSALLAELAQLCDSHNGLWNAEAEQLLLQKAPKVIQK
jgi:threonine dehydrogenase-like Zn-dependent dehydrogenase